MKKTPKPKPKTRRQLADDGIEDWMVGQPADKEARRVRKGETTTAKAEDHRDL